MSTLKTTKHIMIRIAIKLSKVFLAYTFVWKILLLITKALPTLKPQNHEQFKILLRLYMPFMFLVRFTVNTQKEHKRHIIAEDYLIPISNLLFDKNYVNFAQITLLALEEFFLSKKTEKDFEDVLALISPSAIRAGERFREHFPLSVSNAKVKQPRIGFVGHFVAISGYEVILGLGPLLKKLKPAMFAMKAFDVVGEETTQEAFNSSGIEFNVPTKYDIYDVFTLRKRMLANPVDVAIWPLPPFHMFFLFSFGLAPKQVWFSQYLRPNITFKYLDEKITPGGAGTLNEKEYNGTIWNVIPQVSRIVGITETESKHRKKLFTPARLEKLKQPEFLECVAQILKRDPSTHFNWTGYYPDKEVSDFFKDRGLELRNTYLPWMNNDGLQAEIRRSHAILACFPLSLGTVESMAAHLGTPVLSLYDNECNLYWRDIYWEALNGNKELQAICMDSKGKSRILISETPHEYVESALKVIADEKLAETYRDVYRRSYNYTYLQNPNDVGTMVSNFIDKLYS